MPAALVFCLAKQLQSEYADLKNMEIPNFGDGGAAEFL
jgi:hypothetical protein